MFLKVFIQCLSVHESKNETIAQDFMPSIFHRPNNERIVSSIKYADFITLLYTIHSQTEQSSLSLEETPVVTPFFKCTSISIQRFIHLFSIWNVFCFPSFF